MHAALRFPKDNIFIDFGQFKCTMLYVSTFGFLVLSAVYKLLGNYQEQGWSCEINPK